MNPAVVPVEALDKSERNVTSLADERLLARVLSHVRLEQTGPLERLLAVRTADGFLQTFGEVCIVNQSMGSFHVGCKIFYAGEKFLTLYTVVVEIVQNGCAGRAVWR